MGVRDLDGIGSCYRVCMTRPQMKAEPKPPFPKQKLPKPGLESDLEPRPKYLAPRYKAAGKLEGKVALITGGDSGIGRAVAVLYAREGADVAITALPAERRDADETRRAVELEGRTCLVLVGDLTTARACRGVVARTVKKFGCLDILVINAAHQNRKKTLADVSDREWDRTFKTNIYAYFWLARAALPHLKPGASDYRDRIDRRVPGFAGAARLLGHQRRRPYADQVARPESRQAWNPSELRRTGSRLDAAQRRGQGAVAAESRGLRKKDPARTARAARRGGARVCILRIGRGCELHHRGGAPGAGWRDGGGVTRASGSGLWALGFRPAARSRKPSPQPEA